MKSYTFKVTPPSTGMPNNKPADYPPYYHHPQYPQYPVMPGYPEHPVMPGYPQYPVLPQPPFRLAHSYTPWQYYNVVFSPAEALDKGTLFPELYQPQGFYGPCEGPEPCHLVYPCGGVSHGN